MPAPLVEACLIVKDEEPNLPRCLEALSRLGSLLTAVRVYDTGSSDRTVAIARAAGCDVQLGYWDDNFARARNESLAMASSIWALIVDADEEIDADVDRIRAALAREDLDVLEGAYLHLDDRGVARSTTTYVKFLRRDRVQFVNPVHEVPVRVDGAPTRKTLLDTDTLQVRHWGYTTAEVRQAKAARNEVAAAADVARRRAQGDHLELAVALYNHGRTLSLLRRYEEAAAALAKTLQLAAGESQLWRDAARQLMGAHLATGAVTPAMSVVSRAVDEGHAMLAKALLADVLLAEDRAGDAYAVLSQIDYGAASASGLRPTDIATSRLTAAAGCGRADEELASLLIEVATRGRLELIPQLLSAWGDQPPEALAALMRGAAGGDTARLAAHLARAGGTGSAAAALL